MELPCPSCDAPCLGNKTPNNPDPFKEENTMIFNSLGALLAKSLPLLDTKSSLENTLKILKLKEEFSVQIPPPTGDELTQEDSEILKSITKEALLLFQNHASHGCDSVRLLGKLFESAVSLLESEKRAEMLATTLQQCKHVLCSACPQPWSDTVEQPMTVTAYSKLFHIHLKLIAKFGIELSELQDEAMHRLVLNLTTCNAEGLHSLVTNNILPELMSQHRDPELLKMLWDLISNQIEIEDGNVTLKRDSVFIVLCSLIEFYLPSSAPHSDAFILQTEEFWQIIHCGLVHSDQAIRKQARYLFRRALDFVVNNKLTVKTSTLTTDYQCKLEDWETFFLVLESLEEKQVHLIKPMFHLVDVVFQHLDITWALCALHQVITHDNNFVVKWGIIYFLKLTPSESTKRFFIHKVLPVLNNTLLYQTENGTLPDISITMTSFVHAVANQQDCGFFKSLLSSLLRISWAPIPLYHVAQALGHLPPVPAWDNQDLHVLKDFLVVALACQSVFLRATVQSMLLRASISLVNTASCDVTKVLDIISMFNREECFTRGHKDWELTTRWLKTFVSSKSAENLILNMTENLSPMRDQEHSDDEKYLSIQAIARAILLLCDCGLVSEEHFLQAMRKVTLHLEGCEARLYLCQRSVDASLELLVCLMEEWGPCPDSGSMIEKVLIHSVASITRSVLQYLQTRLKKSLPLQEFFSVDLHTKVLDMLATRSYFVTCSLDTMLQLVHASISLLEDEKQESGLQTFLASRIIEWSSHCLLKYRSVCPSSSWSLLQDVLEVHVVGAVKSATLNYVSSKPEGAGLTRDVQTLWGRTASKQLVARWSTLSNVLDLQPNFPEAVTSTAMLNLALEGIELGGPEILPPIMKVLKFYLHVEKDVTLVRSVLSKCYSLSFEHRKNELFWFAIREFVTMTFNFEMLQRQDLTTDLIKLGQDLAEHGQLVVGLYNLVIQEVTSTLVLPQNIEALTSILVGGLLFGPVLRKDQKIVHETCLYIESLGQELPANSLLTSQCRASLEVRVPCISFIIKHSQNAGNFVTAIVRELLSRVGGKSKYFADSQLHRVKLRMVQALLVLEKYLKDEGTREELLEWGCNSLIQESHQPSVRYMIEWLLALLLLGESPLESFFLDKINLASVKRQGSLVSFISVLYLRVLCAAEEDGAQLARLAEQAMRLALPWSMAQQYNIRLYAQVVLLRVWTVSLEHGVTQVTEKYATLQEGLRISLEQGSAIKNALRLQDDFYFSGFKPVLHYSIETIYYQLPRLSNVSPDEWISVDFFKNLRGSECAIKLNNTDTFLSKCAVASWIIKATGGSTGAEGDDESNSSVVQRKLTPWKSMFPEQGARERRREGPPEPGLVVVASLVDRAPNLGGLSRTCEVLAASELVLGSLRVTEDPLFQSLSVSADRWITLSEVRPSHLPAYLSEMKERGYTLIAAEQTSRSVPLQEMQFPKRSLLLLGNEKEGIPAELLPLLDVCVEVPQHGVVRSLNVHVTGALFIWQYFQQHHLAAS